jgi:hypothetical protein
MAHSAAPAAVADIDDDFDDMEWAVYLLDLRK